MPKNLAKTTTIRCSSPAHGNYTNVFDSATGFMRGQQRGRFVDFTVRIRLSRIYNFMMKEAGTGWQMLSGWSRTM